MSELAMKRRCLALPNRMMRRGLLDRLLLRPDVTMVLSADTAAVAQSVYRASFPPDRNMRMRLVRSAILPGQGRLPFSRTDSVASAMLRSYR